MLHCRIAFVVAIQPGSLLGPPFKLGGVSVSVSVVEVTEN